MCALDLSIRWMSSVFGFYKSECSKMSRNTMGHWLMDWMSIWETCWTQLNSSVQIVEGKHSWYWECWQVSSDSVYIEGGLNDRENQQKYYTAHSSHLAFCSHFLAISMTNGLAHPSHNLQEHQGLKILTYPMKTLSSIKDPQLFLFLSSPRQNIFLFCFFAAYIASFYQCRVLPLFPGTLSGPDPNQGYSPGRFLHVW